MYIINSNVKVEINDVVISKSLWLLQKALLCCHEKNRQLLVKENLSLRDFSVS